MSISHFETQFDPNLIQGDCVQYEQSEAADLPRVFRDKVSNLNFLEFTIRFPLMPSLGTHNIVFSCKQAGKPGEERNSEEKSLFQPVLKLTIWGAAFRKNKTCTKCP